MSLSKTVQQIQQVMRKDPGLDGDAQRIAQLSWLLFLRASEDANASINKQAAFKLPPAFRWSAWAKNSDISGQELLTFVNDELLPGLKTLKGSSPMALLFREVFSGVHNYMRSGALLKEVVSLIDAVIEQRSDRDEHLLGDVYEKILSDLQSAGNAGEFYTPKAITDVLVEVMEPKPTEKVLDFACGTGGFLVSCLEFNERRKKKGGVASYPELLGVEKKAAPYLLCVTNLLLHGYDPSRGIQHGNLLDAEFGDLSSQERVDIILTNPPFGAAEEESVLLNFPTEIRSRDTADLFVALVTKKLKVGGRAAIVLPDGFLFGAGVKRRIRKLLLETCNVHTILRLPKGVFSPYTGIATNVLFLEKGSRTESIWFFEHQTPAGIGSYSKTKPIKRDDLNSFVSWWANREDHKDAWKVRIDEIESNDLRLDCKKPERPEEREAITQILNRRSAAAKKEDRARREMTKLLVSVTAKALDPKVVAVREHLEVLANSDSGLPRLERMMLALAMDGQLSSRPKKCTPTSSLLEGRELFLDEACAAPASRRLPPHWECLRLDQVGKIEGGGTPDASDAANFADVGTPWLTPADLYGLDGKYISKGRRFLSEKGLRSSSAKIMPKGTVLFSSRAPIGYVAIASNPIATNQGFKSCIPKIAEMSEFIYYFLLHERARIEEFAPGTTFKEVSGRHMKAVLIPCPPLEEQASIVKALDGAIEAIRAARAARKEWLEAQDAAEVGLEKSVCSIR